MSIASEACTGLASTVTDLNNFTNIIDLGSDLVNDGLLNNNINNNAENNNCQWGIDATWMVVACAAYLASGVLLCL